MTGSFFAIYTSTCDVGPNLGYWCFQLSMTGRSQRGNGISTVQGRKQKLMKSQLSGGGVSNKEMNRRGSKEMLRDTVDNQYRDLKIMGPDHSISFKKKDILSRIFLMQDFLKMV